MNLYGTLSFDASGKTLKTGGTLTLKSTDADTARIADITSNATISGNVVSGTVTIERYISPKRAWHLLAVPIAATGAPSINAAWQQGGVSPGVTKAFHSTRSRRICYAGLAYGQQPLQHHPVQNRQHRKPLYPERPGVFSQSADGIISGTRKFKEKMNDLQLSI